MKKIILLFIVAFSSSFGFAQGYTGVKITFHGFICHQQTADDIFDMDGAGDEIYIVFIQRFRNNTSMKLSTVYGDSRKPIVKAMAGSASILGGIKTGDWVRAQKEYTPGSVPSDIVLLNMNLAANEMYLLTPTVWEYDNNGQYGGAFTTYQQATIAALNDPALFSRVSAANGTINFSDPGNYNFLLPGRYYGLDDVYKTMFRPFANKADNRPVGLMTDMAFSSQIMLITPAIAIALSQYDFGHGKGIVPVQYNEISLGNTAYHGNYTILLKVEVPGYNPAAPPSNNNPAPPPAPAPAPTPAPAPSNTGINVANKKLANNKINMPTVVLSNEILYGVWNGTRGFGTSATDEVFSFKFSNNVFWLLKNDGSGTAIASGGYKIENGNFIATCTDGNNYQYNISSASYNSPGKELTGTWTCTGSGYYKTGKWISKKIIN